MARNRVRLLILVVAGIVALGVIIGLATRRIFSPSSHYTVSAAPSKLQSSVPTEWASLLDASARLDLDQADSLATTPEEKRFVSGIRSLVRTDSEVARESLLTVFEDGPESDLQWAAAEIYGTLLARTTTASKYVEFYDGYPGLTQNTGIESSDRDLFETFSNVPTEFFAVPDEGTVVHTRVSWFGLPEIEIRVNGKTYWFVLDTGASVSAIGSHVAEECGIEPIGEALQAGTSTSRMISARPALIENLNIGEILIKNHPVAIVEKSDLQFGPIQIHGVIGWPVFEKLRIEINYAGGESRFLPPSIGETPAEPNLFWLGYPYVQVQSGEGHTLIFELDTGARESSIQEPIFDKLDLGPRQSRGGFSMGAGGGESVTRLQVSDFSFVLSGLLYRFDKISTRPASDNGRFVVADGRLGSDIAHDGVMIVDFQRGVFEVRK